MVVALLRSGASGAQLIARAASPLLCAPLPPPSLQGRQAQPSLRYLTLIRDGAVEHGLTPECEHGLFLAMCTSDMTANCLFTTASFCPSLSADRRWLGTLQHYEAKTVGQRVGRLLFTGAAFVLIFPVWAGARCGCCGMLMCLRVWCG